MSQPYSYSSYAIPQCHGWWGFLRGFTSGFPFVSIMCAECLWDARARANYGHVTFGTPMTKLVLVVEPEAVSLVKEVRYTGRESFYFTAI